MAIYLALFAVMWQYAAADDAPDDEEQKEGDGSYDACCSLIPGSASASASSPATGSTNALGGSRQHSRATSGEHHHSGSHGSRGASFSLYPGDLRHVSFSEDPSTVNSRTNSIAEAGVRVAFG